MLVPVAAAAHTHTVCTAAVRVALQCVLSAHALGRGHGVCEPPLGSGHCVCVSPPGLV